MNSLLIEKNALDEIKKELGNMKFLYLSKTNEYFTGCEDCSGSCEGGCYGDCRSSCNEDCGGDCSGYDYYSPWR